MLKMTYVYIFSYLMLYTCCILAFFDNEINLECRGKSYKNVTLTAYFPSYDEDYEDGLLDMKGVPLRTLQDFLDDRNQYVTLAMDKKLRIPYGSPICIPELNQHFGHRIRIQVRDTSSELTGTGYSRADICVRSETDSYDKNFNKHVTLVFE
ncbi:hypothetical protein AMK59_8101, partial [Oryctes borbonicus]